MTKNRPTDVNALAARIVAEATGQAERTDPPAEDPTSERTDAPRDAETVKGAGASDH